MPPCLLQDFFRPKAGKFFGPQNRLKRPKMRFSAPQAPKFFEVWQIIKNTPLLMTISKQGGGYFYKLDPPWRQGREAHVVGGMVWLVLLPNWAWDRWFTWITIRRRLYHQYLFYCDFWHFLNIQVEINSRDVIARHRFPKMHPSKVISFFEQKLKMSPKRWSKIGSHLCPPLLLNPF